MRVGRNDPCPCASGKKYKKCCLELDRQAGTGAGPGARQRPEAAGEARRRIIEAEAWEADVVPMTASFGEDPASRPGVLLVVADGLVVHVETLDRPSPEPEALAATLEGGLAAAAEKVGELPPIVRVRHLEVGRALAARLASRATAPGVEVEAGCVHDLDEVAFSMFDAFSRGAPGPAWRSFPCRPDTWAAWDLPAALVARIFRSAAAFHRGAPWTVHANLDVLRAATPGGRTWTACILGQGGQEYGLALYSEPEDFWELAASRGDPWERFDDLAGCVVSLLFEPGRDLHRALRREVAAAGWEVAGPEAYPQMVTINTPAGGLLRAHAEDLAAILEAVPRFVAEHPDAVEAARPVEGWRDRETGVVLAFDAEARRLLREAEGLASRRGAEPPAGLVPGSPEGPGADPQAALERWLNGSAAAEPDAFVEREKEVLDRFVRHLSTRGKGGKRGLAAGTVDKHWLNADTFLEFLAGYQGVPLRAVHEYDLRVFLHDWFHRKVVSTESQAKAMPASLERFFAFLEAEEGIVCPWARPVLADRDTYEARRASCPGHFFWEDEVQAWRAQEADDLGDHVLLPDDRLGAGDLWSFTMGPTEAELHQELERRWLLWRDGAIRAGAAEPAAVFEAAAERQHAWEAAPHPGLGGKTPYQAIRAERREREAREGGWRRQRQRGKRR